MKKMFIIAAILVASASWARDVSEIYRDYRTIKDRHEIEAFLDAITTEEWRAIAEDEISSGKKGNPSAFVAFCNQRGKNLPLSSEYDERYSSVSAFMNGAIYGSKVFDAMPKSAAQNLQKMEEFRPACARAFRNHRSLIKCPAAERINVLVDLSANNKGYCWIVNTFDDRVKNVIGVTVKAVKKALRERGDSFIIGPDGKNKVQDAIDELSAALNAPRANGAREWVAKWFPQYEWIEPKWMSDAELKEYCDSIYLGQLNFSKRAMSVLRLNLGLEEYNKFVEKYNK